MFPKLYLALSRTRFSLVVRLCELIALNLLHASFTVKKPSHVPMNENMEVDDVLRHLVT